MITSTISTELSWANPTVTYTLKGHFTRGIDQAQFRLLRGDAQATEASLFIEKAQVWLQIEGRPDIARQAAARLASDYANMSINCANSTLNVNGVLTTSNNRVGILLFKDGTIVSSASDLFASFDQDFPLSGSGNYYAKVREINNDGNEINSASVSVNCSSTSNPPANSNPPNTNCSYSEGQYLFTTSWGEATYAHYYNGVLYAGYQDGSNFKPQRWLVATGLMNTSTASCFAENDPHTTYNPSTNPPSNPNPPSGNCSYSEGQYLFTFNSEVMYAHYYNGVLYAAYQNGSEFRPRHWLVATGLMNTDIASCFAEDDPHNGTTNPSNPNPTTNTNGDCSVASPRGVVDALNSTGIWGWALDESDLNKTVTIDIYVNDVKVAYGKAREDRSDLVPAFGNNPAARYHGFHAEWDYNRDGNNTYTITAKICGTNTVLASQQITFLEADNSGARKPVPPVLGGDLNEVTVRAKRLNPDSTNDWTNEEGSGSSGNTGNTGSNGGHTGGTNPGGTGTSNTGTSSIIIDINISQLKNSCMTSAYNSLIETQLKSKVLDIVNSFKVSKTVTVEIVDRDLQNPNVDGETRVTNASDNVYEIALNTVGLANASKDYIAATIIHEMVHVYLPSNDGDTDHEVMAQKYVIPMANALKAAGYALTYDDAVALSWGGLQKTKAWKQLVDIDRVAGTNVTGKILQTNKDYRNATGFGARCN